VKGVLIRNHDASVAFYSPPSLSLSPCFVNCGEGEGAGGLDERVRWVRGGDEGGQHQQEPAREGGGRLS
jgi:hypothetical protein